MKVNRSDGENRGWKNSELSFHEKNHPNINSMMLSIIKKFRKQIKLLTLLVTAFHSATLVARAGLANQYFPLSNGDFRVYQASQHPATNYNSTETIIQTNYNGHSVFALKFHDLWNLTSSSYGTWYLGSSANAISLYGITTTWGNLPFNSPVDILTDTTLAGAPLSSTLHTTGVLFGNTVDVTVNVLVASYAGPLTIPAGSFYNVRWVWIDTHFSLYGYEYTSYADSAKWTLATNVGIIVDSGDIWDVNTRQFTYCDCFEKYSLINGSINSVTFPPPDNTAPTNSVSYPKNGDSVDNPVFVYGTASDAGLGGSGIALITVNGKRVSCCDTTSGDDSMMWFANAYLPLGTNTIVIVTKDGAGNSKTNLITVVENNPPLPITVRKTNNVSTLTWKARSEFTYQWQFKTNLNQAVWNNLGSAVAGSNLTMSITDSSVTDRQRFYRIGVQ